MVGPDREVAAFQHVAEMPDSQINSKELPIKGTVLDFCWSKFLGEESNGLAIDTTMRKDGAHRDVGGIRGESQDSIWIGMH